MDLFKLFGTIAVDGSEANRELDKTARKGEDTAGVMSKAFSSIGRGALAVGKAVGVGLTAAGTAVGGLVAKSTQAYAEYEQLVGGVDTLFKESSAKVQAYAEQAYVTAGLSANEYMNTVTSFSASLLQSLGGDTEKAADKADVAIRDMSDNANKMGTSMESIQNAYQGFAKQNYTMLDNLKLGYGGTKEEMQRLLADAEKLSGKKFDISSYADVVDAIHVIQTEMGITGTTAEEAAGTITGSMASVKGAWTNLVTAMASDDLPLDEYIDKFVESAATMAENMLPRIQKALGGVVKLVDQLAPVVIGKIPELISQLLPSVVGAATNLVTVIVSILPDLVQALVDMAPALIDGFVQIITALVDALPDLVEPIVAALPTLIPALVDGLMAIFVSIAESGAEILQPIVDYLPEIITTLIDALINNLPIFVRAMGTFTAALAKALPEIISAIIDELPDLIMMIIDAVWDILPVLLTEDFKAFGNLIGGLLDIVWSAIKAVVKIFINGLKKDIELYARIGEWFKDIFGKAGEKIKEVFAPVLEFFRGVWDKIREIFAPVTDFFRVMFENAWIAIQAVWSVVAKFFEVVWQLIRAAFKPVVNWFKNIFSQAWEGIKAVWSSVAGFFSGLWEGIKNIFAPVGSWFKTKFTQAWNGVKTIFSNVKSFFIEKWNQIKEVFSGLGTTISDSISGAVKKGINGVIGGVENIINGFFGMINNAIDLINEIPGVEISELKLVSFTRLAKGGVVDKPTPAVFGEDGAEAVVPLENNTGWINRVAEQLHELTPKNDLGGAYSARMIELQGQGVSEMRNLNGKVDTIIDILARFFPELVQAVLSDKRNGMSKREFARLVKETI